MNWHQFPKQQKGELQKKKKKKKKNGIQGYASGHIMNNLESLG